MKQPPLDNEYNSRGTRLSGPEAGRNVYKEVKQRARFFLITKISLKNIFHSQLGLHAEANNFHCELVDYKVPKATIKEHCSTLILTRGITIMTVVQI